MRCPGQRRRAPPPRAEPTADHASPGENQWHDDRAGRLRTGQPLVRADGAGPAPPRPTGITILEPVRITPPMLTGRDDRSRAVKPAAGLN